MADLWSHSNGGGVWTHRFSRHPNNWEIEDAKHFFSKLLVKGVVKAAEDKVCWLEAKSGSFSIRVTLL